MGGNFDAGPGHAIVLVAIHISSVRFLRLLVVFSIHFLFTFCSSVSKLSIQRELLADLPVRVPWAPSQGSPGVSRVQVMDDCNAGYSDCRCTLSNSADRVIKWIHSG